MKGFGAKVSKSISVADCGSSLDELSSVTSSLGSLDCPFSLPPVASHNTACSQTMLKK